MRYKKRMIKTTTIGIIILLIIGGFGTSHSIDNNKRSDTDKSYEIKIEFCGNKNQKYSTILCDDKTFSEFTLFLKILEHQLNTSKSTREKISNNKKFKLNLKSFGP